MGLRSRQYPHLTRFLQSRAPAFQRTGMSSTGCFVSAIAAYGAFFLTLPELGVLRAALVSVLVIMPLAAFITNRLFALTTKPRTPEAERAALVNETLMVLHSKSTRRRMGREVDPVAAALLEESARHWTRVQTALSGPFWSSKNLPAHWQGVRDRSWAAANAAMDELILLLRPLALTPPADGPREGVLDAIMEAVFDQARPPVNMQLPPGFEPARAVAERLKLLAGEVERTSKELAEDQLAQGEVQSATALESCLAELRSLRQAEQELEDHLEERG